MKKILLLLIAFASIARATTVNDINAQTPGTIQDGDHTIFETTAGVTYKVTAGAVQSYAQIGVLKASNNLSDLGNPTTARTNLGIGSAGVQSTSFFLIGSNNLSDIPSLSTARTNLGLGSLAVVTPSGTPSSTTYLRYNGTTYSWASVTPYTLPAASVGVLGGVAPDGSTVLVDGSGNIAVGTVPYTSISGTPSLATVAISGNFSDLGGKPTTISGYGIADGATLTGTQTLTGKTINGASNTITIRLGSDVTGTLPVANGGTGNASLTTYAPLIGGTTGTGAVQSASSGMNNSGWVFTSTGTSSPPAWVAIPSPAIGYSVVSSSTYSPAVGENIASGSAAVAFTLPASPSSGNAIVIADVYGNVDGSHGFSGFNQTVSGGGHNFIFQGANNLSSITLNRNFQKAIFIYVPLVGEWTVTETHPPTIITGTLSSGTATATVPSGSHPTVTDTASTPNAISVTVSGTTATVHGTGTDTFTLVVPD